MRHMKLTRTITHRESQSLAKYLNEIRNISLLSPEEEVELSGKIKKGDEEALNRLVTANLKFVVSVAKQYQNYNLSLNDLINEGNLGLIIAARKFDETKGFKFISYAVWWIRQSILKAITEQSKLIRLPFNKIASLNKLNKMFSALEQKFGREPTDEELSEVIHMNMKDIDAAVKAASKYLSFDEPVGGEEDFSLHDILEDTGSVFPGNEMEYTDSLRIDTERILASLTERQKNIIEMYFGFRTGRTMVLEEIAVHLKLTKERIRQIKEEALQNIRDVAGGNCLNEYLCR